MNTAFGVYRGQIRACRLWARKPESKRPLGRTRFKWEDIIKTDLEDTSWKKLYLIYVFQDGENKKRD